MALPKFTSREVARVHRPETQTSAADLVVAACYVQPPSGPRRIRPTFASLTLERPRTHVTVALRRLELAPVAEALLSVSRMISPETYEHGAGI